MKYFILSIIIIFNNSLHSQTSRIDYSRVLKWSEIARSLPYLSKEEKDRISMTWAKDRNNPEPYILLFDQNQAIYYLDEDNLPPQQWNWRREKRIIHTLYSEKKRSDNIEVLGKTFIIDDQMIKYKWKILNEIKEVAGYVCMKAETTDTIKNQKIVAWFSSEIPISLGPEGFNGLPGMILEIDKNDGQAVISATKIQLDSILVPIKIPKKKGKKVQSEKLDLLISKHIRESIVAHRNPYWSIYF
ncbi:MAG: GLPGLI family protein [Saprospiraceae bacterium]|nr:GLPGLI family protein [Saprospiraceae bacterium]